MGSDLKQAIVYAIPAAAGMLLAVAAIKGASALINKMKESTDA